MIYDIKPVTAPDQPDSRHRLNQKHKLTQAAGTGSTRGTGSPRQQAQAQPQAQVHPDSRHRLNHRSRQFVQAKKTEKSTFKQVRRGPPLKKKTGTEQRVREAPT